MSLAVAQFMHYYPGMYLNPCWPTRDRVVPWTLFWLLYGDLHRVMALGRVNTTRAVGHWHAKDPKRSMTADRDEAFDA